MEKNCHTKFIVFIDYSDRNLYLLTPLVRTRK